MEKTEINAKVTCNKDKSNLTATLYLTQEDMEKLLVEKGEQPKGMFGVVVKEIRGGNQ